MRDPLDFLCVSHSEVTRVVTLRSSGTTGLPKRVFFTEADLERTIDFFQHGMSTLVQAGQRVLILLPGVRRGVWGICLSKGSTGWGRRNRSQGPVRHPEDTIDEILARQPDCLVGIPYSSFPLSGIQKAAAFRMA